MNTIVPLSTKETPNLADSNISESSLVFISNNAATFGTVTLKTSGAATIATFDVPANGSIFLKKKNTELVRTSAATLSCTASGYAN